MVSVVKTGLRNADINRWIFTWRKDDLYLFALFYF